MSKPHLIGNFVQPFLVQEWSVAEWEAHYDRLLEAGINIMILQWTSETPSGRFAYVGYDSNVAQTEAAEGVRVYLDYVPNALLAAENKGVKVFVGLNFADEWWKGDFRNQDWIDRQVELNNALADEMYNRFKRLYPDAFYGWYWGWEMYNDTNGDEKYWAQMMNGALQHFTELDPSMPVLMSPFISGYLNKTPEETGRVWESFFEKCHFRPGDIFCSQDSVGATQFEIDDIEKHVAAMKQAASLKPYVRFWINVECFSGKTGEGPAPFDRVKRQMEMAAKYAEELITFSYSHYYLDKDKPTPYHDEYLRYLRS